MENFKDKIKADNKTIQKINAVEKEYKKSSRKLEFKDKIALAVYSAIEEVEVSSKEEEIQRLEYMMNINKILCNYEELRPILTQYFKKSERDR